MKYKSIILLFFLFVSNYSFAQFFETEEDYVLLEGEEVIDTTENILPENAILSLSDSIVAHGKSFMGTPYRYGGSTPAAFDCSGFIMYIHNDFGFKLPRTATAQYLANTHIDRENLRKGDLVFFEGRKRNGKIGHVGMVVSDSLENGHFKFIHASVNKGVIITSSSGAYYDPRYLSACRVVGADSVRTPKKNVTLKPAATPQSAENKYHTVKKGESLYSISKKYGKTVAQIKALNGLSSDNLKIGQRLLISKGVKKVEQPDNSTQNADSQQQTIGYVVKAGDTLYKISKQFNTTVEKIKQDNNLTDDNLTISQKLIINANDELK